MVAKRIKAILDQTCAPITGDMNRATAVRDERRDSIAVPKSVPDVRSTTTINDSNTHSYGHEKYLLSVFLLFFFS